MALFQTAAAKGLLATPSAYQAGILTTAVYEYVFDEDYATATDKIELGRLPADVQIVGATVIGAGLGAVTADVGIMSGAPSDPDNDRTVGDELFDAQSVNNTEAAATLADCLAVARSDKHRAVGAVLSGNVAAGAAKKLTLRIDYVA